MSSKRGVYVCGGKEFVERIGGKKVNDTQKRI